MSRRFQFSTTISVCLFLLAGASVRAQNGQQNASKAPLPTVPVTFKDGKGVSATGVRRMGDNIIVTVVTGSNSADLSYPVSVVARIEFPEPSQIKTTTDLLLKNDNPTALTTIDPILRYYETYKDVSGSWWMEAMLLKLKAYENLHRDQQSDDLIDTMAKAAPPNSEAAQLVRVLQATSMARKGQHEKAVAEYDAVIKTSTNDNTLAYAWVNKGASLFALQQYDPSLLAYLHIPVFYPDETLLLPTVMLGSGRNYARLENLPEAEKTFNDLIQQFPSSPEATSAKAELKKLPKGPVVATDASAEKPADSSAPQDKPSENKPPDNKPPENTPQDKPQEQPKA